MSSPQYIYAAMEEDNPKIQSWNTKFNRIKGITTNLDLAKLYHNADSNQLIAISDTQSNKLNK